MRLGRLERTGQGAPSTRTCSPPGSLHSPTPVIPGSPGHRRATHRGTMGLPALAGCQPHPATWACWGRGAPSSAAGPGLKQGRRSRCPAGPAQPWSGRKGHCPSPQGSPGSRAAEDAQGTDGRRRWRGTKEGKPCWKRRRTQVPALVESVWFCRPRRLTESPRNFLPGGRLLLLLTSPLDHSPRVTQAPWDSF